MASASPSNKLQGLQVLRATAALLVLWFHLDYNLGIPVNRAPNFSWLAPQLGAIGVDIFFVISGFVIAMTASKLENDWKTFLVLRFARVVPLYFAASTYALIEAVLSSKAHGSEMPYSWQQIFNTYGFIPFFDGASFNGPILVNGWTLSYEMWFYLGFALLMRFVGGVRSGLQLPYFMAAAVALKVMVFPSAGGSWGLPKFLLHPIVLEFCAGALLFHYRNFIGKGIFYTMSVTGIILLFLANKAPGLALHRDMLNDPVSGLHRAAVWGGFAACLVGVVTQIDIKYSWRWPRLLTLLGDASYSIYLLPGPLMMTFAIALHAINAMAGHQIIKVPPSGYAIIYVLGTVFCSVFCWKYFETPTNRWTKNFLLQLVPKKTSTETTAT